MLDRNDAVRRHLCVRRAESQRDVGEAQARALGRERARVARDRPSIGFVKQTGNGSGSLVVGGSKLALQLKIIGSYELTGSASHVLANGSYTLSGRRQGKRSVPPVPPREDQGPVRGRATEDPVRDVDQGFRSPRQGTVDRDLAWRGSVQERRGLLERREMSIRTIAIAIVAAGLLAVPSGHATPRADAQAESARVGVYYFGGWSGSLSGSLFTGLPPAPTQVGSRSTAGSTRPATMRTPALLGEPHGHRLLQLPLVLPARKRTGSRS